MLETEQAALTGRLGDPQLHAREPQEAARVASRLGEIETELLALLERWEALEARTSA
jgi:ATP-binding cassette subfamily F protein uup